MKIAAMHCITLPLLMYNITVDILVSQKVIACSPESVHSSKNTFGEMCLVRLAYHVSHLEIYTSLLLQVCVPWTNSLCVYLCTLPKCY